MTESQIVEILPLIVRLNAWCRVGYDQSLDMNEAKNAIYAMKNQVISDAIALKMATTRIVAVERPCKTCEGTGTYEWHDWNDEDHVEYQDCRRCSATGKVILRFAETTINRTRFHTPRPKSSFLNIAEAAWGETESTDWEPEQPGRSLSRIELFYHLNAAEKLIVGSRHIHRNSPLSYHLDLGTENQCFVCGRIGAPTQQGWLYTHQIYRPGIRWKQFVCDFQYFDCDRVGSQRFPLQWPANLMRRGRWAAGDNDFPKWTPRCPLPELAHDPCVIEWLARRGIVVGQIPPGEYGWWRGEFVEVEMIGPTHALISGTGWLRSTSNYGPRYPILSVPRSEVRARFEKQLTGHHSAVYVQR